MNFTTRLGALAPMLLLPLALGFQGQTGQQGQQPKTPPGQSGQPGAKDPMAKHQQMQGRVLVDAESLVGTKVVNRQGEDLGRIDELVFDQDARISYAVLSFGGWLGMGDKLFALPWSCLELEYKPGVLGGVGLRTGEVPPGQEDRERTRPAGTPVQKGLGRNAIERVVLQVDRERLKTAPGFERKNWPTMGDVAWCHEVDQFYAQDIGHTRGQPREAGAPTGRQPESTPAATLVLRLDDLQKEAIKNHQDETVGRVQRVVIEPNLGRAAYAVVGVGGFLGIGSRDVAVPLQAIKVVRDGDDLELTMNTTKEQLERAPQFDDKDPMVYDPTFLAKLYTHYGVQPYWNHEMGADPKGKMKDDLGNDPEKRRDH